MARCRARFFDPDWYLRAYPDVARAGMDPVRHFQRYGQREGRQPCFTVAPLRERDLRWGLLEGGEATLEALARSENRPDAVWAAIALARSAVREGDWLAADRWLSGCDAAGELVGGFCEPDPVLLAIEAALMAGDPPRARALLALAVRAFGKRPDFRLAAANIAAAGAGHGADWQKAVNRLYTRAFLGGLAVTPGDGPAFDRLRPARPYRKRGTSGPLVSVIMPAFNAAETIETALRSLTAQSWQALEILVVENGSTDGTAQILRRLAPADPRIRILDGTHEPGAYPARNIGAAAARGAFITVLDADDWAHPARIARQVKALMRAPARAAAMTDWVRVTPDLRFTHWWKGEGLIHSDLSSLMIRAPVLGQLGFWDRTRAGADTEYHDRIRAHLGAQAVVKVAPGVPLNMGRVRADSLTQSRDTSIDSQVFGPRRSYAMAARRWHRQGRTGLPLPQHPEHRPFDAPESLTLGDAPARPDTGARLERAGLFDEAWYMRSYPDLRARDMDGLAHYLADGATEGRDPCPGFSTSGYALWADVPRDKAALHYMEEGQARGFPALPDWNGALPAPASGRHLLVFGHQAASQIFGAERSLLLTLERIAEAGFTPSVVLPRCLNRSYLEDLLARSHKVHLRPYGWLYGGVAPDPRTVDLLAGLIRQTGAAAVHQNTVVLDAPLRAAALAGVPAIVHAHELPATDPQLCMDLGIGASELRAHLARHATGFVANSQAVAQWLDQPAERTAILPPARIDPALAALPFAPAALPRVALVGSLTARKGIGDFVSVAREFARMGGKARFVLIGPASADLAALGPLPSNTRHAGYAASPAEAMAQADIVLSLSHVAESFGLSVQEALSAGRPVICYDRGTPPDLLGPDPAGAVVPADDPRAVARALHDMLAAHGRLGALSHKARARGAELAAPPAPERLRHAFDPLSLMPAPPPAEVP